MSIVVHIKCFILYIFLIVVENQPIFILLNDSWSSFIGPIKTVLHSAAHLIRFQLKQMFYSQRPLVLCKHPHQVWTLYSFENCGLLINEKHTTCFLSTTLAHGFKIEICHFKIAKKRQLTTLTSRRAYISGFLWEQAAVEAEAQAFSLSQREQRCVMSAQVCANSVELETN